MVEAGESHHHTTCVLVIATVLLVPIFTEFAMHNGRLGQFTFRLIDTFISVRADAQCTQDREWDFASTLEALEQPEQILATR